MKVRPKGIAAGFKKAAAPQFKTFVRAGNQRLLNAEGIPPQLPIIMVGCRHSSRQLQIVFLRDFVQLVYHLLGVDIVGVIFYRRLEFSLGGHIDGVVGIVALAEFIPLLGGLLLRGILQALERQNCFCDLRCLVSFPIGVNPGRCRGFVFIQLQLLCAEGSDGAAHKNCHCGNDCRNQKGFLVFHRPFPFRRPMTGCGKDVFQ